MPRLSRLNWAFPIASVLLTLAVLKGSTAPEEGIAAKYVGDVGIENDPHVVFAENFEAGSLADVMSRWTDVRNREAISLVHDAPPDSPGFRSLEIASAGGVDGGHLYQQLATGHDRLYLRYYVKYASGTYHHTGGWMGGYNPPTPWPQGGAGERPAGNDRFSVGAEPVSSSLRFDFYVYWMHMRTNPTGTFFGNDFIQDPALTAPVNQWVCVEFMIQLNNPVSRYKGELALWIDGRLIIHLQEGSPNGYWVWDSFFPDPNSEAFEGFQWRNDKQLNINWIWLQNYVTEKPAGKVWFDHVVLANKHVGPIQVSAPQ